MVVGSTRAKQTPHTDGTATKVKQERADDDGSKHSQTALVYDPALAAHKPWLPHQKSEPEVPLRVETVMNRLQAAGLSQRCDQLKGRQATKEELLSVHTTEHLGRLDALCALDETTTERYEMDYDSVYISPGTRDTCILAAGCACEATASVVSGRYRNAVAVVRPPGHHAYPDVFSGFCFVNNVAVSVRQAQKAGLSRILILDWDIHHGNGTQFIFQDDPSVLFISLHRYDHAAFYPSSELADPAFVGQKEGAGYSVNIGWNEAGLRDMDYKYAFDQVVMPIGKKFDPELVLVSAGFDGAKGDPLGNCDLMPRIYNYMTTRLQELADGKVVIVLEGGYNCESTAKCMSACVEACLGDKPHSFSRCKRGPTRKTMESVQATIDCHRPFWPDLPTVDAVVDLATRSLDALDISGDAALASEESDGEDEEKEETKGEVAKDSGVEGRPKALLAAGRESTAADAVMACSADTTAVASSCAAASATSTPSGTTTFELTTSFLDELSAGQGFAINPKTDCPHAQHLREDFPDSVDFKQKCERCDEQFENWMCLTCHAIACGREVKGHMAEHGRRNPDHYLVVSFADHSVWCYACDSYISTNPRLQPKLEALHLAKFGVKTFGVQHVAL